MDQKHRLVQLDKMAAEFSGRQLEAELAATEKAAASDAKVIGPMEIVHTAGRH